MFKKGAIPPRTDPSPGAHKIARNRNAKGRARCVSQLAFDRTSGHLILQAPPEELLDRLPTIPAFV